jgi:PKD repeat protein
MRNLKRYLFVSLIFGIINNNLNSQNSHQCATEDHYQEQLKLHPELAQKRLDYDNAMQQFIANQSANKISNNQVVTYVIPVVVHVIHQYGAENISDAQIEDQIRILNEDFQRNNSDSNNTPLPFRPLAGRLSVEFRLARKDPNGFCTNGIVRLVDPLTNGTGSFSNRDDVKALSYWDANKYLNIWVVNFIEPSVPNTIVLGYAQFPGLGALNTEGLVLRSSEVGSIGTAIGGVSGNGKGRTASHEIGHCMNLRHIWGDANCGNDFVNDTPTQSAPSSGCPSFPQVSCSNGANGNMFTNYMDYVNGSCMNMFSAGQVTRMTATLNNLAGGRQNLWQQSNLILTGTDVPNAPIVCKPKADFSSYKYIVCANTNINLKNSSWNTNATSYLWKLIGPTTYLDTNQNPVFAPSLSGTYDVRLIVANANGMDSLTRSAAIVVKSNIAQTTFANLNENFPSTFTFTNGWESVDPDFDNGFQNFTGAGVGDNSCLKLDAQFTVIGGSSDYVETPGIDLTNMPSAAKIIFYWAFAKANSTVVGDKMTLDISTNCGQTWQTKVTRTGTTFKSTSTFFPSLNFAPISLGQWKKDSLNIGPLAGPSAPANFKFRVKFTNDVANFSNPFYLDKIGIEIPSGLEDIIKAIDLKIYPNPSNGKVNLAFNALSSSKLDVKVETLLGQTIFEKNYAVNFGTQNIDLSKDKVFAKGMYLVKFNIGDVSISKKMVIE